VDALKNVLVVIDKPKHEQIAFQRALALQKAGGTHLHLTAFAYHPIYDQKDVFGIQQRRAIRKEIERQRTQWLRDQVLDARAAFSNISIEVVWTKDIAAWITDRVRTESFDVVLKSINQSRALLHTPLDWELLREAPVSVMLCTAAPWRRPARVLACVDLRTADRAHDAMNERVLDAACLFSRMHGGDVHCVYALDVPRVLSELNIADPRRFQREAQRDAMERLRKFSAAYGIPPDNLHVPMGKVGHVVNRLSARLNADLMVMGTAARTGLKGLVIGNSAEKVLTRARCDVLALKA
jgi:universal stress protein E